MMSESDYAKFSSESAAQAIRLIGSKNGQQVKEVLEKERLVRAGQLCWRQVAE